MLICQNSEINVLVDLLRKDEVVAVPTDTVFGVCARYDHIQAQENLRDLKKRPETKAFPIMCADMEQVLQICEMCEEEKRVMNQFMPGPLTMILKKKKGVPSFVNGGKDTIAIRLATSPILAEMIGKLDVGGKGRVCPSQYHCFLWRSGLESIASRTNFVTTDSRSYFKREERLVNG